MKTIKNKMKHVFPIIMNAYTRDQLREIAAEKGIKRGRDKADTVLNILMDGRYQIKLTVCIETAD